MRRGEGCKCIKDRECIRRGILLNSGRSAPGRSGEIISQHFAFPFVASRAAEYL